MSGRQYGCERPPPPSQCFGARAGLTLFELLAALTLGAILLASLSGVMRGFTNQVRAIDHTTPPAWKNRLTDRLTWDLLNARRIQAAPNRIMLEGFASRDPATARATFLPSRVVYFVRTIAGERWLLRSEQSINSQGVASESLVEYMAVGIDQLLAGRADDRVADLQIDAGTHSTYDLPADARVLLLSSAGTSVVDVVVGHTLETPR